MDAVGYRANSGMGSLLAISNANNETIRGNIAVAQATNVIQAYKNIPKNKLTKTQAQQLNEALYMVNKKDPNNSVLKTVEPNSVVSQRASIQSDDDRLLKARMRLTTLGMEKFGVASQLTANKLYPQGANPDVKQQQLGKINNEIQYTKKIIEQIEAAKAQKEESIKQTKALSDNTTATKNLTDAIGKLGNLDLGATRENYSRDKKGGSGAVSPFSNQKLSLGMPWFGF